MKIIKAIFKHINSRVWVITSVVLLAFLLAVNLVLLQFYDFVCGFLHSYERVDLSGTSGDYYEADFATKEEAKANGNKVSQKITEEGFVLLKNENNILPMATSESKPVKVSVFGKNSVNLVYGGSGSGATVSSATAKSITDSLKAAHYSVNPTLQAFYESSASGKARPNKYDIEGSYPFGVATYETPWRSYPSDVLASLNAYNDLALVVLTRLGGEGNDLPTTMLKQNLSGKLDNAVSGEDHYLELDQDELDMLQQVCERFKNVVLVINSSNPMELGFLLDSEAYRTDTTMNHYDYASHIDGAVWIGGPGEEGIMSLGKLLCGDANFSGKTVDLYATDFTKTPSYNSIGWGNKNENNSYTMKGSILSDAWFVDYEEGIYVGYRYYETADFEASRGNYEGFDYEKEVVFPFGYGLSYTNFSWEIKSLSIPENSQLAADSKITITVEVTNEGDYDGMDVVEVYVTAPYIGGEIEKSHVQLVGFAKTDLLTKNGGHDEVEISFSVYDFASYDYSDANHNQFKGYELDGGQYEIKLMKNSHDVVETINYEVADGGIQLGKDPVSKTSVVNRFDDVDDDLRNGTLSRADFAGTWPARRTDSEKEVDASFKAKLNSLDSGNPLTAESEIIKNANLTVARVKNSEGIQLWELMHEDYDSKKWDELISRIVPTGQNGSMMALINRADFKTIAIDYIGKPATIESDGPAGFVNFLYPGLITGTCAYPSECVIGSTWNVDLVYKLGKAVGNEGILGNGTTAYSGWYSPGVNIHRSQFGGRNYEYFSEDPVLTGKLAAAEVQGCADKGVYCYVKHFIANEQETNREGVCTWLTEQSLRELYLRPYEYAVKEGGAKGVMSAFNRIGTRWVGGDYRLLTEVLREEWGFRGSVISDFATAGHMNSKQMTYAGGDLLLNNMGIDNWIDLNNPVDVYVVKLATKNILYTMVDSAAMNGIGEGVGMKLLKPVWEIVMYVVDGVIAAGMIVWGVFAVRGALKKQKEQDGTDEKSEV